MFYEKVTREECDRSGSAKKCRKAGEDVFRNLRYGHASLKVI